MNGNSITSRQTLSSNRWAGRGLACLVVVLCLGANSLGQTQNKSESSGAGSSMHVTHVLGFESAQHNAGGELIISGDALQFRRDGSIAAQVSVSSIQNISIGSEDDQVGGVPLMLGKTAVPFGGGRVVSLFTHKKYDSLTIEYLDPNGGFHGAIFRLNKGQGQTLKTGLIASGAHLAPQANPAEPQSAPEVKNENK